MCITIAEPNTYQGLCAVQIMKPEVKGVAVGRKAIGEVTLINSLIEVTSVTFAQNAEVKQRNLVRSKSVSVNE